MNNGSADRETFSQGEKEKERERETGIDGHTDVGRRESMGGVVVVVVVVVVVFAPPTNNRNFHSVEISTEEKDEKLEFIC